jgi:hypothetical protein
MIDDEERKRMRTRLDEHGEAHVRYLLSVDGLPHWWRPVIAQWLVKKETERRASRTSSASITAGNPSVAGMPASVMPSDFLRPF